MPIAIQQLTHHYGEIEALRGISVQATPGKITAVLGPNASGKTTLLRCIIGAIRPTSGRIVLDGKTVHTMRAWDLAQKVAYVPQRSIVSASFTVREVVELGRFALKPDPQCIDHAIERMALTDIEERPYTALSVGQQQRVTLARALAQLGTADQSHASAEKSRLLVLDEPMSAMDLSHVRHCVRLLRELSDAGVTILLAMHDLALVNRVADEVWLLKDGCLVASGEASSVMQPDQLSAVFDVQFEWALHGDGRKLLSTQW